MYYVKFVILGLVVAANVANGGINEKDDEEFFKLLRQVEEKEDGGLCCTPLSKVIVNDEIRNNVKEGPCKDTIDECEREICIAKSRGFMDGDKIIEAKYKEELTQIAQSHPDTREIVDSIIRECLSEQYKEFQIEDCPALQLKFCYYIVGSMYCPEASCDKTDGNCKKTCNIYKELKKYLEEKN